MRSVYSHLLVALVTAVASVAFVQIVRPFSAAPQKEPPNGAQEKEKPVTPKKQTPIIEPAPLPDVEMSPEEKINLKVYQNVNPSVVNITTESQVIDFFISRTAKGSGSGSVLDKDGHIVTNFHVIEDAKQIAVTLIDGSVFEAKVRGIDSNNDLAVLKIKAPSEKLIPITWGDSNKLVVGLRVFALGNPFGMQRTLTTGIISSLNRSLRSENNRLIRGVIQTDAAINPGNSGGPLLNRAGHMIGITTAIIGRAQQSSGIGLAVPANTAKRVVRELIKHGRVIRPDAGIVQVYETNKGLLIARLLPNGPAENAGLRGPQEVVEQRGIFVFRSMDHSKADLIVAVDGKTVRTFDDFLRYIEEHKRPGDKITVTFIRDGRKREVSLTLTTSPG